MLIFILKIKNPYKINYTGFDVTYINIELSKTISFHL